MFGDGEDSVKVLEFRSHLDDLSWLSSVDMVSRDKPITVVRMWKAISSVRRH